MDIERKIFSTQNKLLSHKIYESIHTIEELQIFMSAHVFAVWDFMSLAKRLQISMTSVNLPWMPPINSSAARLINEIIFYEETDVDHSGLPCSHLEMYLSAMREINADTSQFDSFMSGLNEGMSVEESLKYADVPDYIAKFVRHNISCAINGQLEEVASSFLFGREDAIPKMFSLFLEKWKVDRKNIPTLVYYLKRHIELDGDEHGPAAHRILSQLIGDDPLKEDKATIAAISAIDVRIYFWDGVYASIQNQRERELFLDESVVA
jgi:hypothetical protein